MSEVLFPPTPAERLDALQTFVATERRYRHHMIARHPAQAEYWSGRLSDADKALEHIEVLRAAVEGGGTP